MTTAVAIPVYACLAAAWWLVYRYDVRMFQQNSYKPDRYLRWALSNPVRRPFISGGKAKVKFVMTRRMARLTVTATLIVALLALWSWIAAAVAILLADFVILAANALNSPLEKAISGRYTAQARRMLRSRPDLVVIGITGSFGKTSTKNYLSRILSERYNVLVTPGNYNTTLGVVRTVREMLRPHHQVFIVEMGAKQPGDIREICELVHPSIGIVTAVGNMHLETFGSLDNVRRTKFELLEALPPDGLAVINAESAGIASAPGIPASCKVISYGIDAHRADFRAAGIASSSSGTSFDVIGPEGSLHLETGLLGACNILNIEAALAVAGHLGVSPLQQKMAVATLRQVEHRLSVSRRGAMTVIDDAYNSNPEGARMALDVLQDMPVQGDGLRIAVTPGFVEMGGRQREENFELGRYASRKADVLIVVNLLNRDALRDGAMAGGMAPERIILADSLDQAVAELSRVARGGDVVLYENDLPDMFK